MQPSEQQIVEDRCVTSFSIIPGLPTAPPPGVGRPANPRGGGQPSTSSVERTARPDAGAHLPAFAELDDLLRWASQGARDLCDADECLVWLRDPCRPDHYLGSGDVDRLWREDVAMLRALTAVRVPVHAQSAPVGAVEVVGPRGGRFTVEDGQRLEAFADDVGAAYELLLAHGRTRWNAMVRSLRTLAGVGLTAVGLVLVFEAAWVLAARALPLSLLPARPAVWSGTVLTVAGLLLAIARRRGGGAFRRGLS
jgi:hypothetical protein